MKLSLNIDHVATLREQRKEGFPQPYFVAVLAEKAGVDGITIHLRGDRRHTQESDLIILKQVVKRLNLEMAITEEMIKIAKKIKPDQITLVPEKKTELTTEGGLDIIKYEKKVKETIDIFHKLHIDISLFIEPDKKMIKKAKELGSNIVELHTGTYAHAYFLKDKKKIKKEIEKINNAVEYAHTLGLRVHIGHGLTLENIKPFGKNPKIEEASIGHSLIGLAIYEGIENAIKKMREVL